MTEESRGFRGDSPGTGAQGSQKKVTPEEATQDAARLYEAGYFEVLGLLMWIDEKHSKSLVEDETSKLEALGHMTQMALRFIRHLTPLPAEDKLQFAFHLIFGILNALYRRKQIVVGTGACREPLVRARQGRVRKSSNAPGTLRVRNRTRKHSAAAARHTQDSHSPAPSRATD
jgi:hypothetical protein